MNEEAQQQQHWDDEARPSRQDPIVTSGESDEGVLEDSSDDEEEDHDRLLMQQQEQHAHTASDILYDENADAEDEAYVYKYLRSGSADEASNNNNNDASVAAAAQNKTVPKPRNSDAVLACPCCLSIVCMDCQQHERYVNQYRAMFVMNILVRWDCKLQYDADASRLVPYDYSDNNHNNNSHDNGHHGNNANHNIRSPARVPNDDHHHLESAQEQEAQEEGVYYTVCCANCQTQVASLDMSDEVYHFYGCVASA